MIVHGRADDLVPPIASELIAEAIGHAQVHWYPGCGHSPFYENAERFNLDLAQFAQAAWDARCGGN
jgi:pimeloyl-ACP methyl ester carboxylesterase